MDDDKKLADAKIKAWNRRLVSSAPSHRAPEPEKKPEEKTEDTAASDAAVDENKAKAKAAEPEYTKTMTAQIAAKGQQKTDDFGTSQIHLSQKDANATAPAKDFKQSHSTNGAIELIQSTKK